MPEPEDSESNPWQTLSSELKYANAWIEVSEHQVLNPAGNPGIYGTVRFRNLAIGVLALDGEDHTWLVGQYRYPLQRYSWEIPEGGGDRSVDPLISAQRELKEEAGIEARDWRLLLELDLSNSVSDERAYIFLATGLTLGEPEPEETERLQLRRLPLDEACAMALHGRITDAMSVAALLHLRLLRLQGEI